MSNLIANTFPARPKSGGEYKPRSLIGKWFYEPKYNGWRAFVDLTTCQVFNRHGKEMSIADTFQPAIESIRMDFLHAGIKFLDCEALERRHEVGQGSLILLDLPDSPHPYEQRRDIMQSLVGVLPVQAMPNHQSVYLCPSYAGEPEGLWTYLQLLNNAWQTPYYEGFVAKKAGSEYPITYSASETFHRWVKFRFADSHTKLSASDYARQTKDQRQARQAALAQ